MNINMPDFKMVFKAFRKSIKNLENIEVDFLEDYQVVIDEKDWKHK